MLPLDTDTLATLSRNIMVISHGIPDRTASDRRDHAKAIGLALALDPSNTEARRLLEERIEGLTHSENPRNPEQQQRSIDRLRQTAAWLSSQDAGEHAHILARCVLDLIHAADPQHPGSQGTTLDRVPDPWLGWIPPVDDFEAITPDEEAPDSTPPPRPIDEPSTAIALREASIFTPLWTRAADDAPWTIAPHVINMTAAYNRQDASDRDRRDRPFSIAFGRIENNEPLQRIRAMLTAQLEVLHGTLPDNMEITITSRALQQSLGTRRQESLGGATLVLANSAFSGNPPDAVVIGEINSAGNFITPRNFWQILRSMESAESSRIVIPAACIPYLSSLLAYEKPGFFLQHEVLLAHDVNELIQLASAAPPSDQPGDDPSSLSGRFREISSKRGNQDVGAYVANRFVRQRIVDLANEAPHHASARMLAIQAAGERPIRLPPNLLAAELLLAIQPIAPITRDTPNQISSRYIQSLDDTFASTRASVDSLDRYADIGEKNLISRTRDVTNLVRSLYRQASTRRGENHHIRNATDSARKDLETAYLSIVELLESIAGSDSPS